MNDLEANPARFQREAEKFARRWLGSSADIASERRYNFMRIRIQIDPRTFIELYHNAQNRRGSYARFAANIESLDMTAQPNGIVIQSTILKNMCLAPNHACPGFCVK